MLELLKKYKKYLFVIEESAIYEESSFVRKNIADYLVLICRYGYIYKYSKDRLCLVTNSDKRLKAKFESIQDISILSSGDEETSFLFPIARFKEIKKIAKPLLNNKNKEIIKKRLGK